MKQPINFSWSYISSFEESYLKELDQKKVQVVDIPHNIVEVPYNYFSEESYQKVVTYEKRFDVDNYQKGHRYFLNFEGYMFLADIYLNGVYLGKHYSGYLSVNIEVSQYIKEKDNRLLVILDSRENKDYPPFGFALDYLTYGGIYREVNLYNHLPVYLTHFYLRGDTQGNINIDYEINGEDESTIHHDLYFEDRIITSFEGNSCKIDNPNLWSVSKPTLYKMVTVVEVNGEKEEYVNYFGFREVEFRKDGFYLNKEKIKLVGLNRHQAYPYMGHAASKALQEDDAVLLKETGLNVVRTSHYPQSEHFLNKCDEIGLLVVDEIPGWQHIGESELWRDNCVKNTERMVYKERNHPSVICYGVRIDESVDDHELYTKTNEIAHKLDPYRQTIGVRNFTNSELLEDIYGYNDFSCDSMNIGLINPKKVKHQGKPYLVTEYMGHMDPLKATSDIDKKIEVSLRHAKVIDDNYKHTNAAGAIGWCFVDYQSHTDFGSGDHICPHGVYDLYRNPKLSSYIYASQQEDKPVLELLTNFKPGDVKEAIFNDLYVATNSDYIELYKNDELVGKFYPNHRQFKYLKHPPILIDDIVGLTFNEAKFPKKSQIKIAKMFSYAAMHGFNHLPLKNKIYLAYMMMRYKVNYTELVSYWNKYVGAWGGKAKVYQIKAYKDNSLVLTKEVGPSNEFVLDTKISKTVLENKDTYDTTKVTLRHLDTHGMLLEYSSRIVNIKVSGPISLVGANQQTLLGGQLTLYFNSKNEKGIGRIEIEMDNFKKVFEVEVK